MLSSLRLQLQHSTARLARESHADGVAGPPGFLGSVDQVLLGQEEIEVIRHIDGRAYPKLGAGCTHFTDNAVDRRGALDDDLGFLENPMALVPPAFLR